MAIGKWVLALFAALAVAAQAQDDSISRIEQGLRPLARYEGQAQTRWTISERMAHYKVRGISIAVISGGKLVWARGYGFAIDGHPVNAATLFQAASISKPVTALTVLRLVDEGKLSLDEDVNLKLRSWKVPASDFTNVEKVTLRRLLNHSAGLNLHGFAGYAAGTPVPSLVDVLDGRKPANSEPVRPEAVPGTKWSYSGGGYVVVQQLLSDVTGKPFAELAREKVLVPLGMTHSTFEQPLPRSLEANAAAGYDTNGSMVVGRWHTYPEQTAAGLWTTPSDLAEVVLEMQRGGRILKPATQRLMLTKMVYDYGLGIGVSDKSGRRAFSHSGGNAGYACNLFGYVEGGEGAVIMTNSDNGWPLTEEVMRSIAAEYGWPDYKQRTIVPVDTGILKSYAARYVLPSGAAVTITFEDGKLLAGYLDEKKFELLPESATDFFTLDDSWPQTFRFVRAADDTIELAIGSKTAKRQAASAPRP